MNDERLTFTEARARLEEIVTQVRKKDVSLEKSLDLLEEGVRLANECTELSDNTEWDTAFDDQVSEDPESKEGGDGARHGGDTEVSQDGSPDQADRPADGPTEEA